MRKETLFVDSSVIISGLDLEGTNSEIILDLIRDGKIRAVISGRVFEEVSHYMIRTKGEKFAHTIEKYLKRKFQIISRSAIVFELEKWRGRIKEKDLEHLATAKMLGLRILAFDRDFKPFKEYVTPKQFVKALKLKPFETGY